MNKKANTLLIAVVLMLVLVGIVAVMLVGTYNSLVGKDVSVQNQWGKVQSAYQRRLDLIPNLVSTVKGSADFEKTTQTQIAALRSGINAAKSPSDLKPVDVGLSSLTRSINVQLEAYPQLTSTDNFRALQDELAGTENRVKWERDEYNNQVKSYQTATRVFPNNILAGVFGFYPDKYKFFEATQGAENPPQVNFNFSG
jgi:LemA protein